ncbi:MAG: hypothetical protein HY042_06350 [Spirochaetia bacterium]|nr:hypothetical protein [Spirochaetia bacterium]
MRIGQKNGGFWQAARWAEVTPELTTRIRRAKLNTLALDIGEPLLELFLAQEGPAVKWT